MRNRIPQPHYLDLPPVEITPIRVYGQLMGPMAQPAAYVKIMLKGIETSQLIVKDTWSECTTDSAGNYDFSVNPGRYAVFLEQRGVKTRVNNISVYSDSLGGTLQSFMLTNAVETLTPVMVLEIKAALEGSTAAMLRARQWAENPIDTMVLDIDNTDHDPMGPGWSAMHYAHMAEEIINGDTNINWRGEWNANTQYKFRDAVRWRPDTNTAFSSYYCIEDNKGVTPPTISVADNAGWSLMDAGGENGKDGADSTEPGPPGEPGPANVLTIGTVTAVPYGTAPSVTISGTSPSQKLDFKLETGPQGDTSSGSVMNVRLGAKSSTGDVWGDWGDHYVPAGCVLVGLNCGRDNDTIDIRNGYYQPIQELVNDTWKTVEG